MKNFIVLAAFSLLFACTPKAPMAGYKIIGNIQGLKTDKVYLFRFVDKKWTPKDTATVQEGVFNFTGNVELPEMCRIVINEEQPYIQFFLENSEITINANIDSLRNFKVAGSKTQDEYLVYLGTEEKYRAVEDSLSKLWHIADSTKNNKEKNRLDSAYEANWQSQLADVKTFMSKHKASVVAPYLAMTRLMGNSEVSELDSLTNQLDTTLRKSLYTQILNETIALLKKVEIGQPAVDFTLNTPEGKPLMLSSLYGKYILIDFWASWCNPCRQENPNVVKAYKKYKAKGFDILGVSLDKDKTKWEGAIKSDKLTWHHVSDLKGWDNEVAKLYGIRSIPSNVLLDKKGVIIAKNLRGEKLEEKLKELLK